MLRLFVGFRLPDALVDNIKPLLRGLEPARFTEIENLHLTLRFIGEVAEDQAEDVFYNLDAIRAPKLDIRFERLRYFGSKQPSHLWLGASLTPELLALQAKIESACVRSGLPPEGRRFTPHVTLAKLGRGADLAGYLALNEPVQLGQHEFQHFSLFRSHLGRNHASYEGLEEFPLS